MSIHLVRSKRAMLTVTVVAFTSVSTFAEIGNPRVNQHGYLPTESKVATYANDSTSPLTWKLVKDGQVMSTGSTTVYRDDSCPNQNSCPVEIVHRIDFSTVTTPGEHYEVQIGDDKSYPFKIDASAYTAPTYDAIRYFYHNRSGIEIETAYTGGGHGSYASDSKWARPAGHINAPGNPGDYNVPCWPGTCDYTLDVPKGWYDAGDHGKYVVTGGISVWKLLNAYERALYLGNNINAFADGMFNIPESGNGIPDLLDEARWELEFLMAMQVPAGKPLAGMVHHKMHDEYWTNLPLAPHEDTLNRYLVPPGTAATLHVAAVGAQCARLWQNIDSNFAQQCLSVAKLAWEAALANPNALYNGGYDNGGGDYKDFGTIDDEFIWAAAELYITTGERQYADKINTTLYSSEWSWANTQAAGLLSLATVPSTANTELGKQAKATIIKLADELVNISQEQGYEIPMRPIDFRWGSNNSIANKMMLLGSAYDVTHSAKYIEAFGKAMDYLYGRNRLSISYITGYGENAVVQPHHRFWAGALDNRYPWAPPGLMAGGANPNLEDSKARSLLNGCQAKPQTCFADDIEAYSVNEITINWNSAFFWVSAFYDDYATSKGSTNASPSAMLTASATAGEAPFDIAFDATGSTDADGDPLTYNWTFGDGNDGSGQMVNHTYTTAGTFVATLAVSDGQGAQTTERITITITAADNGSAGNGSADDGSAGDGSGDDGSGSDGSGSDGNDPNADNGNTSNNGNDTNENSQNNSDLSSAGSVGTSSLILFGFLLLFNRKQHNNKAKP